jgi:DNA modification methylase
MRLNLRLGRLRWGIDGGRKAGPRDALIPYARNARTHTDEQVAQIAASIKEFGWTNPILVDGDNGVIAGHGRLAAARKLGMTEVPVIELAHLTETQKRAYILADNRLAEKAGWDNELLSLELADLKLSNFDIDLIGFSADECDALIAGDEVLEDGLTDDDAVPDVSETPVSKAGDVWLLGRHRVMCGDSTIISDVEKLMAGEKANMVFTDPPYNVAYEGKGENNLGVIKNDDMSDDEFEQFLRDVFTSYWTAMRELAPIYVCHPDSGSGPKLAFEKTFAERFRKSSTLIWFKQSAGMGWQDYRVQHEPILYGWKAGKGTHYYCGDRSKTTVWQIGRDAQASYVHPTQKPVALPSEAIANSSKHGDTVLDLFGGSGSTLIACEKTGRNARIMEIDPKYVDVIVRRWQEFTGKKAIRQQDGVEFDALIGQEPTFDSARQA